MARSPLRVVSLLGAVIVMVTGPVSQAVGQVREATPKDIEAGARDFRDFCVSCHGRGGTGGRGPDLTRGRFRYATTDEGLFRIITNGRAARGMPAFEGVPESELWQIVPYVRSLSQGRAEQSVPGDPAVGERIFRTNGACMTCHVVNGEGGLLGPDLSSIGWQRSPQHLRTALTDPDDEVPPEWWSVRVVDRNGRTVEGRRMDEDTYSVRVRDMIRSALDVRQERCAPIRPDRNLVDAEIRRDAVRGRAHQSRRLSLRPSEASG